MPRTINSPEPLFRVNPEDEKPGLELFFRQVFFLTGAVFFVTTFAIHVLKNSSAMHDFLLLKKADGTFAFRLRYYFLTGSIFVVMPLYRLMAFFRHSTAWMVSILVLFPLLVGFYISMHMVISQHNLFDLPLTSAGCAFLLSGAAGMVLPKETYLKTASHLRFAIGLSCLLIFHKVFHPPYATWFIAIPMFWLYDYIAAAPEKLIRVSKIVNPPFSFRQRLLVASISILLFLPGSGRSDP